MSITKFAVAAAAFSVLTAIAAPANVVGSWKGKIVIDKSKVPPSTPPEKLKMAEDMFAKMSFSLTLKKDGTYITKVEGAPGQQASKPQSGKWSIKGNDVTILLGQRTQVFALAKNGKSFSAPQGPGAKIIFTRQ